MKWLKDSAPLIILAYSLVFALLCAFCPYDLYSSILYPYLSQSLGFSFFTNLVFASFYFNKYYCWTIKFSIIGLFLMNFISIICVYSKANPYLYDIFISVICLMVYISHYVIKKNERV